MFSSLPALWLRIAVIYFAVAVSHGVWMGASGDHSQFPLHAHLNLLGWVSMALFSTIGAHFPSIANNVAAKIHFWIYNLSLPLMAFALHGVLTGNHSMEPVLGMVSAAMALAIFVFAGNVLFCLRNTPRTI
jgi:hypothetical protein